MEKSAGTEGPIVLYGATGYTGKLVAAELLRQEADFVLAGRDPEKLERVATELETVRSDGPDGTKPATRPRWQAAGIEDARGLRELFDGSAAVISCAGPFSLYGEPVLAAALDAGAHYLDTTGEQPFILSAFEGYGKRAAEAGLAVLPAMGYDYVPADLLVAMTADGLGAADRVRVGYHSPFQPSRGTARSSLEMFKGGDLEWRDGALRPAPQQVSRPDFDFGGPLGVKKMMRFPSGEHITVPRHLRVRTVETSMSADSILPTRIAGLMPLLARPAGLAMRTPVKKAINRMIALMPEGADPEGRTNTRFQINCEITNGRETRRGRIAGTDVYGLTAALIVKGALAAARGEIEPSGALAPAEAFEPERFLGGLDRFGLEWSVESV
ncbi:MAG: saccharopine dehydrogenase NADP-binding domain-containing protein [Solirubrobacterales bacterium]|nr:saccharopine dehydrogenase NADP-binding domain-containing protein [Solirubrobacterales bacterium]